MTDDALFLLDEVTKVPGASHACIIMPDRKVLATAGAGNSLQADNAWRALSDTFNVLNLHRLNATRQRWVFGNWVILSLFSEGFTLGAMIDHAHIDTAESQIHDKFQAFLKQSAAA